MHKHTTICTHRIFFSNKLFIIEENPEEADYISCLCWEAFYEIGSKIVQQGFFSSSLSQTLLYILMAFNNIWWRYREWLSKSGGQVARALLPELTPPHPVHKFQWIYLHRFKMQWLISATPALEWAPPTDEQGQGEKGEQEAVTSQLNLPKCLSHHPE